MIDDKKEVLETPEEEDALAAFEAFEAIESIEVDTNTSIYRGLVSKYNGEHKKALFEYCFLNNIFFNNEVFDELTKNLEDDVFAKMPQYYIEQIDKNPAFDGLNFFSQLKIDNFEKIYSEDLSILGLTEEDRKNRQTVIETFSYDPFKDESMEARPQLYRDLASMTTEAMRKDVAKQKAALSIVRGYSNLEKYQQRANEIIASGYVDEDTQKQLETYVKMQKSIQDSINTTAEKNNFTVKGIGSNGHGMLSDVMNQVEERGYDKGITNFYDIATSKSIEEVANISWKAKLNQLSLSKTDYCDILANQAELVRKALKTSREAMEALRLAKEKLTKQELLEELELDYRRKGISEDEIQEFIGREYHLQDGKD